MVCRLSLIFLHEEPDCDAPEAGGGWKVRKQRTIYVWVGTYAKKKGGIFVGTQTR